MSARDDARSDARRARVIALLQQAVDEECFGPVRLQVTTEHAEAIADLLLEPDPTEPNLPTPPPDPPLTQ
jgi:hypothetical protein